MTPSDDRLFAEWQNNRHLPPEVRLEEDFDALLDAIELELNCPPDLQAAE
jgi:hypothetical protein